MNALLITLAASALTPNLTPLTQRDTGLTPIAGTVTDVRPLCPEGVVCFVNGTVIDLSFTLLGCLDRLGPVTYNVSKEDERLVVNVSALNIHDRRSLATLCYMAPVARRTLTLINQYGDVDVRFLTNPAPSSEPATALAPSTSETRTETNPFLTCQELVDHGPRIDFYKDANGDVSRAVYSETTIIDDHVVAEMNICERFDGHVPHPDGFGKIIGCHDANWRDSYEVEVLQGGFAGITEARLYKGPQDPQLLMTLLCKYN